MRSGNLSRLAVGVLSVSLLAVACGGQSGPEPEDTSGAPARVTGVIVDIDSAGIDDIRAFTLRSEGQTYEIHIAEDVEYGFSLGHLQEHRVSSEPVVVDLEEREDGRLYALSIEDA